LFSFFSNLTSSKKIPNNLPSKSDTSAFNPLILRENAVLYTDFTLYHQESHLRIDLLLFLPHYGLYLGEKLTWSLQDLKGASIKRLTHQAPKIPHTQIESTEKVIYQKLQDVLSFDSTPIERIFWMQNLTKDEFESLAPSFHELLPKARLIFKDDTALDVRTKLYALREFQATSFSNLKVIGSLNAHTLLLPTSSDPFGSFLSYEQQVFLDAPIKSRSILSLCAPHSSGKSTVLIRKVMDYLLAHPDESALIITPTPLSGELLRNEFIAIMEFAAVKFNLAQLHFYTPFKENDPVDTTRFFQESALIACDDLHLLPAQILARLLERKGSRSLLLSGISNPLNMEVFTLSTVYRSPAIHTVTFSHTKGALFTLLVGLKTHLETTSSHLIMIILPTEAMIVEYKHAIETHLRVKCRVLNNSFSLQYDNLEEITLSTPEYVSGLNVPHSYLINLSSQDSLYYPLALSRASDTVTIISESHLEG
jgi:hypothetical protein